MVTRPSRAYKLKLSPVGIALFLDCHNRLCHLVGDLLPYGTTLRVSVMILEAMPTEELVSHLGEENLIAFIGSEIRFVGTSPDLAAVTAQLSDRAISSGALAKAPRTWLLFIAALSCMRVADDAFVLRTYTGLGARGKEMPQSAPLVLMAAPQ